MTRPLALLALFAAAPLAAQTPADSAATPAATPATAPDVAPADTLSTAEASARFLAEVAARPGVERSRSGLLWTVERSGSGQRPMRSEAALVSYVGRLADGTVFDASPEGAPVRLPVRAVVAGFAEALQAMRPGETRTVYLPPDLAYGRAGVRGPNRTWRIPPDAALVFEITLVRVVP